MMLSSLSNDELLRHAHAQLDPLTGTELEAELLKRFETVSDEHEAMSRTLSELEDRGLNLDNTKDLELVASLVTLHHEFTGWNIRALLEALNAQDLDNPEALTQILERDAALRGLLDDLADPIARLHRLANPEPTTEGAN